MTPRPLSDEDAIVVRRLLRNIFWSFFCRIDAIWLHRFSLPVRNQIKTSQNLSNNFHNLESVADVLKLNLVGHLDKGRQPAWLDEIGEGCRQAAHALEILSQPSSVTLAELLESIDHLEASYREVCTAAELLAESLNCSIKRPTSAIPKRLIDDMRTLAPMLPWCPAK